jgi:hypothetical protein
MPFRVALDETDSDDGVTSYWLPAAATPLSRMDIFQNTLTEAAGGAAARLEAELEEDSDAVVAPLHAEHTKMGALLSNVEGGRSALLLGLQALVAFNAGVILMSPDIPSRLRSTSRGGLQSDQGVC